MIPITKNIRVIDEQGNEYEATYPKRARGLVKNGRARFINESTLCIACPPSEYLEDKIMTNINETMGNGPRPASIPQSVAAKQNQELLNRLMETIENLVSNTHYISEALNCIKDIDEEEEWKEHKTQAMVEVIRHREDTNKEALKMIQKLTDHLTGMH